MIEIKVWLALVLLLEVPAVAMVWQAKLWRNSGLGWDYLAGIYLLATGLVVQVGRSMEYIKFDAYPVDEYFPLWVLKDIGASILLFCFVRDVRSGKFRILKQIGGENE